MKKALTLVAFAAAVSFVACGPSAEEKAAAEKKKNDSIAQVVEKAKADSIANVAKADSIAKAAEAAKKGGKKK